MQWFYLCSRSAAAILMAKSSTSSGVKKKRGGSGVLPVCLYNNELHVLMQNEIDFRKGKNHSKAGSFIDFGGKAEPQDKDEADTAAREFLEEILRHHDWLLTSDLTDNVQAVAERLRRDNYVFRHDTSYTCFVLVCRFVPTCLLARHLAAEDYYEMERLHTLRWIPLKCFAQPFLLLHPRLKIFGLHNNLKKIEQKLCQQEKENVPLPWHSNVAECRDELKLSIRRSVWETMEIMRQVSFPQPCRERIPNFLGAEFAAEMLFNTPEFRKSSVIKVNPSLAQTYFRQLVLTAGKCLVTPSPALEGPFMLLLDPSKQPFLRDPQYAMHAATKAGALEYGIQLYPTNWPSQLHIDMVIVASVAVCPITGARLGKGLGFGDLEWATLYELGAVDNDTIVATTVHDLQVLYDVPVEHGLLAEHDLPVQLLVTPSQTIRVCKKLPRPFALRWDRLSEERLSSIPSLMQLFAQEQKITNNSQNDSTLK